jgi:hypothetical protein
MKFVPRYFEACAWMLALLAPVFIDPVADHHFSLCFFKNIGLSWCPGCGLGHSLAFLYRGDFAASFQAHPLGIATIAILAHRIYILLLKTPSNQPIHEPTINEPDPGH